MAEDPTALTDPVDPTPPADPSPVVYNWRDDIHPDVKNDKVWESVPDVKTLTKAYADATKYNVGALKLPQPDAPVEEWGKVFDKLGRPASPEAYEIPDAIKTPMLEGLRGVAHTAGITSKQWAMVMEGVGRQQGDMARSQQEESQTATATLKEEWGGAYDKNLGLVQRVVRTYLGDDGLERVVRSGLGNDVGWIKGMAAMAKALEEQGVITGEVEGVASKESAKEEVDRITMSKEYLDGSHPNHAKTVEKVQKLFQLIYN